MDPTALAVTGLVAVLLLLVLRVPIAFALGAVASVGLFVFFAWPEGGAFEPGRAFRPVFSLLATGPFGFVHSYPLSMIPLFIALGHIAYQAGITTDIYYAIRVWLARLPGGLAMASVIGCGGFSAITGSSVACASAMGRIAVPEMLRYNYSKGLATTSVAAGGTLGSLIPPSLLFVLYGIFTEQSVSKLFLAGVVPGLLSLVGFLAVIYLWVRRNPTIAPAPETAFSDTDHWTALMKAWPALVLFGIVGGGIYFGIFTPTEAAAVSASAALVIGLALRRLGWEQIHVALRDTAYQTAVVFAIAIGAKLFVSFVSLTGIATAALGFATEQAFPAWLVMALIVVTYLVLGMFLDSIGILLLTLPFTVPIVEGLGFDLIWFAVIVIKLLEIGLITPPIGLNVFVIKSVVVGEVPLEAIFRGIARFLVSDAIVLGLLLAFPILSLFLPDTMF